MRTLRVLSMPFLIATVASPAVASDSFALVYEDEYPGKRNVAYEVQCGNNATFAISASFGSEISIVAGAGAPVKLTSMQLNGDAVSEPLFSAMQAQLSEFSSLENLKLSCGWRSNFSTRPNGRYLALNNTGFRSCYTEREATAFSKGRKIKLKPITRTIEWFADSIFVREPDLPPCTTNMLVRVENR